MYRKQVAEYGHNRHFYMHDLVTAETLYDAAGNKLQGTQNTYELKLQTDATVYFPALVSVKQSIYDNNGSGSMSTTMHNGTKPSVYDAYMPYGELLVDEHTSSEDMPYKFNGKELDQETGLYYYGARYMNPVSSLWYGVDAFTEKYPSISGYVYCVGKPIKFVDPDGNKIVFVNGKIGFGSPPAGEQYWNGRKSPFIQGAIKYWNDKEIFFTDKDYKPLSSAKSRISAGYRYAEDNIKK